jgi:hypothetical protein
MIKSKVLNSSVFSESFFSIINSGSSNDRDGDVDDGDDGDDGDDEDDGDDGDDASLTRSESKEEEQDSSPRS